MEVILFGLAVNIITWLSGKLNLSKTYVSMLFCLIGGTVYYVMTNYYSIQREQIVIFVGGAYATSQIIYNLFKKWKILERVGINL